MYEIRVYESNTKKEKQVLRSPWKVSYGKVAIYTGVVESFQFISAEFQRACMGTDSRVIRQRQNKCLGRDEFIVMGTFTLDSGF